MKKTLILSIVASAMLMAGTPITKEKIAEIVKSNKALQTDQVKILKGEDLGAVYFLRMSQKDNKGNDRPLEGFFDKTTKSIYLGGGYDKNGEKLVLEADIAVVDSAVAFTYGSGSKTVYVITDPECPYCKKFAIDSKDKLNDYTVKVILLPLPMHKNAQAMINYIVSGKDNTEKYDRYTNMLTKDDVSYKGLDINEDVLGKYLKSVNPAVIDLGLTGTPTFYIIENNKLERIDWNTLLKIKKK